MPYQTIDHTADLGISVQAASAEELFSEAARALSELIFAERDFSATEEVRLQIEGSDWPDLMVNWLRELLYQWNGKGRAFGPVEIEKLEPFTLKATVAVDVAGQLPRDILHEIKAVTYHQIEAAQQADDWQARVIFDL